MLQQMTNEEREAWKRKVQAVNSALKSAIEPVKPHNVAPRRAQLVPPIPVLQAIPHKRSGFAA